MEQFNYYKEQLKKLKNLDQVSIQLVDFDGNKTKSLDLNSESINELKDFFKTLLQDKGSK